MTRRPAPALEALRLWLDGDSGDALPTGPRYVALISGWRPKAKSHGQNARLHWGQRAKQAKTDRFLAAAALQKAGWPRVLPWPRAVLLLTLICQRGLPDSDALAGMGKSLRDGIARYLGQDDSPRGPIRWAYRWERGSRDGVRLELMEDRG